MRATIISLIVFCAIIIFAALNAIYINMKISELIPIANEIADKDDRSVDELSCKWHRLVPLLRLSVPEERIRKVSRALSLLVDFRGGENELNNLLRELILSLEDIRALERLNLMQIL